MDKLRFIELCDKYIHKQLSVDESKELFDYIEQSEAHKKEFEENVDFLSNVNNFYEQERFKRNIEIANQNFKQTNLKDAQRKSKVYQYILQYTSVAAVAVIAVIFTLYVSGWFSLKHQINAYRQLSTSITKISQNQKSLWNTLFSSNEVSFIRGTAFAISSDGLLATSYHLVKDYDSVLVVNAADSSVKMHARVVAFDEKSDIAILKISDSIFADIKNIPYNLNFNFIPELGTYVYSLGFSKNSVVFGEGSISSYSGFNEDTNSIQISIPTNPGNSGSPVFNQYGEIIGMICGKNFEKEASTYAIKTLVFKEMLDTLTDNKHKLLNRNNVKYLPKNKQVAKIIPYIFKIEIY